MDIADLGSRIMIGMNQPRGKIIIAPDLNVWPHEYETAKALAMAGMTVEFIRRSEEYRTTSADVVIDGAAWEIKAPKAINPKAIERNLRKASHQAANIVFDARRMKGASDAVIERELRNGCAKVKAIKHLIYVTRHGTVIDIQ